MVQVSATRSVTFTGVNWPRPFTSPETFTVMTSRVPPSPTTKRWTWLMATPLASVFGCLVSKSMLGSAGPAETKLTTLVSTGKRMIAPSKAGRNALPTYRWPIREAESDKAQFRPPEIQSPRDQKRRIFRVLDELVTANRTISDEQQRRTRNTEEQQQRSGTKRDHQARTARNDKSPDEHRQNSESADPITATDPHA